MRPAASACTTLKFSKGVPPFHLVKSGARRSSFVVPPSPHPILLPIDQLRPTQVTVGMRAVAAKRERVATRAAKRKKITRFLEKRPIPAVLGPGDGVYIIDHHHLSLALLQSEVPAAFVQVVSDFSSLGDAAFWRRMMSTGWMHPYDETGRRVRPHELPSAISSLRNDPYRDLAWSVREEGGYRKSPAPYAEFKWAQYFREQIPLVKLLRDYDRALETALTLARSPAAAGLPGFRAA
ncbi:MAG: ParB-like protein [Hyphomicrobiaceae bacterium]